VCVFLIDTHQGGRRLPVAGAPAKTLVAPLLATVESATRGVAKTIQDSTASGMLLVSLQAIQALQLSGSAKALQKALFEALEAFDTEAAKPQKVKKGKTQGGESEHEASLARVLRAQVLQAWAATCEHDQPALRKMGLSGLATAQEHPGCHHTVESVRNMLEIAKLPEAELREAEGYEGLLRSLREQLSSSSGVLRRASLGLLVILYGKGTPGQKQLAACYEVEGMAKTVENGRHMTSKLRDVTHALLGSQVAPLPSPCHPHTRTASSSLLFTPLPCRIASSLF